MNTTLLGWDFEQWAIATSQVGGESPQEIQRRWNDKFPHEPGEHRLKAFWPKNMERAGEIWLHAMEEANVK